MKKLLLLLTGFTLSHAASSQTLTIKNYTSCVLTLTVYGEDGISCSSGLVSSGLGAPLGNYPGSIVTVPAFGTMFVVSSDYANHCNAYNPPASPPGCSWTFFPHRVHFIGAGVDIGTSCTGLSASSPLMLGACGTLTGTWTDLPGGAEVEIR